MCWARVEDVSLALYPLTYPETCSMRSLSGNSLHDMNLWILGIKTILRRQWSCVPTTLLDFEQIICSRFVHRVVALNGYQVIVIDLALNETIVITWALKRVEFIHQEC
jgi:hypothetical protein